MALSDPCALRAVGGSEPSPSWPSRGLSSAAAAAPARPRSATTTSASSSCPTPGRRGRSRSGSGARSGFPTGRARTRSSSSPTAATATTARTTPLFHYEWPCWQRELRSDLGMRHLVAALAARGVAAIAPDLNGAFTIGWNDRSGERHKKRWPADRRPHPRRAERGGRRRAAAPSGCRSPAGSTPPSPGLLAHSLSGADAVRYAGGHPISALLLLAPAFEDGLALPDVETAIVASRCDYDVPGEARRYFERAQALPAARAGLLRPPRRRQPQLLQLDPLAAGPRRRQVPAGEQRLPPLPAALGAAASRAGSTASPPPSSRPSCAGPPAPSWMRFGGPFPKRIYGLPVGYDRLVRPATRVTVHRGRDSRPAPHRN